MQMLANLAAIRVFEAAARLGSIAAAAGELSVTPSAVSHRIKRLEQSVGVQLFLRRHNAIELTPQGEVLRGEAERALAIVEQCLQRLGRDDSELDIRIGVSFAARWLMPRLERFKARFPAVRLKLETSHHARVGLLGGTDLAIEYIRGDDQSDREPAGVSLLCRDRCVALVAPALLDRWRERGGDIGALPALQCTEDNWDWRLWCEKKGIAFETLRLDHAFDTDDAAIHAAVGGLGVVLASTILTQGERSSGALVSLPGFEPAVLGRYRILRGRRDDKTLRAFERWLNEEMAQTPS